MWYQRIFKSFIAYLILFPTIIIAIFFSYKDSNNYETEFTREDFVFRIKFFLILYLVWALCFVVLFILYTLFLLRNKLLYHIGKWIKKIRKFLNIKKKSIGKYPIIIQFTPPKWISPSEMSFLYDIKHFKWNISCLFYKWIAEKKITTNLKKKNGFFWLDNVELKVNEDISLDNMANDEKTAWNLIFADKKVVTLPDYKLLTKIPIINIQTAKTCLEKWLIEKRFTIYLDDKEAKKRAWWIIGLWILYQIIIRTLYNYEIIKERPLTQSSLGIFSVIILAIFVVILHATAAKFTRYKLSDKWKKLLAEIYWYKYFLEACDENMIKTFLKEDPLYFDKVMPYAIAIWVETEVIKNVAPKILEWTNNNWYIWDIESTAKTMLLSSERTIFVSKTKEKKATKNKKK